MLKLSFSGGPWRCIEMREGSQTMKPNGFIPTRMFPELTLSSMQKLFAKFPEDTNIQNKWNSSIVMQCLKKDSRVAFRDKDCLITLYWRRRIDLDDHVEKHFKRMAQKLYGVVILYTWRKDQAVKCDRGRTCTAKEGTKIQVNRRNNPYKIPLLNLP